MRILLIASAYNGLTQRAHVELKNLAHEVSITLALSAEEMRQAVNQFKPDIIICPFLKEKVPDDIWKNHICIIIHPGIKGDRGASSLDWAITHKNKEWGVTALQAAEEKDAGDIWATANFPIRLASKASLYRREVTQTAVKLIVETIQKYENKDFKPERLDYSKDDVKGKLQPSIKQHERTIDWAVDSSDEVIQKINAADSCPGVLDTIFDEPYYLFGAHKESTIKGTIPGDIIVKRNGAICRATVDGAVWISHLKRKSAEKVPFHQRWKRAKEPSFKLPAAMYLSKNLKYVDEMSIDVLFEGTADTYKEIWYKEINNVGYLHFDFHNGAMSTEQCRQLLTAYREACKRPTRVIALMGGTDFWSNGIHLNVIEAAKDPAAESWRNINAIDDVVREIITTDTHLILAAIYGGAGAGGAIMPLAADQICAREGCIMNPHYTSMGLYGSEYWTYLLPKRVGNEKALELTNVPLPIGMKEAKKIGMIDDILPDDYEKYRQRVTQKAEEMASNENFSKNIENKKQQRTKDEAIKPLSAYRADELREMQMNFSGRFFGGPQTYHEARYNFVYKIRPIRTANYLATHVQLDSDLLKDLRLSLTY
jgi:putative two-component system hydrogenase maturation factor HypX/HoxX